MVEAAWVDIKRGFANKAMLHLLQSLLKVEKGISQNSLSS